MSSNKTSTRGSIKILGRDELYEADVDLIDGIRRLRVDARVIVEEIFGQDPFPDSYFEIVKAGDENDTWRIHIAGVTDSTATERNLPAVDYTYTVTAVTANKELDVRDAIIAGLNADTNFINAELKAQKAKDIPIVHVTSKLRSMNGEFYERPISGDFNVTVTGSAEHLLGFDNLTSRGKSTSLARDPDSPHRLGILGISGSVTTIPAGIGGQFDTKFLNSGSSDMTVNGSGTPVVFTFSADPSKDTYVDGISFQGQGNGIKMANFLNLNSSLSNGILIDIVSENGEEVSSLNLIHSTADFKYEFTGGRVSNFLIHFASGLDDMVATKIYPQPIPLRAGTADKITVTIQDNLSAVELLHAMATGFKKEI